MTSETPTFTRRSQGQRRRRERERRERRQREENIERRQRIESRNLTRRLEIQAGVPHDEELERHLYPDLIDYDDPFFHS